MRKTTTALAAAALFGAGSIVALATAPAASAADCGALSVTDQSHEGWAFDKVTWDSTGVNSTVNSEADESYADRSVSVWLADYTDESGYTIATDGVKPGFAYYLGITGGGEGEDQLFYEDGAWHTSVPGDQAGYSFSGSLADYANTYPDTEITDFGFNYGSGVPAGTVHVTGMTFNDCSYTFAAAAESSPTPTPTPTPTPEPSPTPSPSPSSGDTGGGTSTGPAPTTASTAPVTTGGNSQFQAIPNTSAGVDTGGL